MSILSFSIHLQHIPYLSTTKYNKTKLILNTINYYQLYINMLKSLNKNVLSNRCNESAIHQTMQ